MSIKLSFHLAQETPVLLIIFNRPDSTFKVFEAIRNFKPKYLYIAADGPRQHEPGDENKCRDARKIVSQVDWDCEVKTLLRKRNLGCRLGVSTAISWFFQHVEQGIILEDDIVPGRDFFPFCHELLNRFKNNDQIMMISGNNFQFGHKHGESSYYFSRFAHTWGWATWRRAWKRHNEDRKALTALKQKKVLEKIFSDRGIRDYWLDIFSKTVTGEIITWDYYWQMALWNFDGIAILPNTNLASNIGFNEHATHTTNSSKLENLPQGKLQHIHHPKNIVINVDADKFTQNYIFYGRINNINDLIFDIQTLLNSKQYTEARKLAKQFLSLYPNEKLLQWFYLLALSMTGELISHLNFLKSFIIENPTHAGTKQLLEALDSGELYKKCNTDLAIDNIKHKDNEENNGEPLLHQIANSISSEPQFASLKRFIRPGAVVFDVGANIGGWTFAATRNLPDVNLHLFEPVPKTFTALHNNAQRYFPNAQLNNLAVAEKKQILTLHYYDDCPTWRGFYRRKNEEFKGNVNHPEKLQVECTTIDDYCSNNKIKHINVLKIDVEGAEQAVINGAQSMITSGSIDAIQFEYGGTFIDASCKLQDIFKFLSFRDYTIYNTNHNTQKPIHNWNNDLENYQYTNYLAIHRRLSTWFEELPPTMLDIEKYILQEGLQITGAIHIGAHEGKEIDLYRKLGASPILLIEANPKIADRLRKKFINDTDIIISEFAINDGSTDNETLHVTNMDQSSSILPLKDHRRLYPDIIETHTICVPATSIDSLLSRLGLDPATFNFLSIDIQGAELLALRGATTTLPHIKIINTEINYRELYDGCGLSHDIDAYLAKFGFVREAATCPYDPSWGDALFVKRSAISMSSLGQNGRFGNQLFQYAFVKHYAKQHRLTAEVPPWVGNTLFGTKDPIPHKAYRRIYQTNYDHPDYDDIAGNVPPLRNVDIWGWFQFPTLFASSKDKNFFRSLFTPTPQIKTPLLHAISRLTDGRRTLIAAHLRRGDFGYDCFFTAPTRWYLEWLEKIWSEVNDPILYLASDEPHKVLRDFTAYNPVSRADLGDLGLIDNLCPAFPDFFVLTQAFKLAISNSSFSFSASMLNVKATEFVRPRLSAAKLIPFNPFTSPALIRDDRV